MEFAATTDNTWTDNTWIDKKDSVITRDKSILFFDNETSNWIGNMKIHEEYIDFIKVNDETPNSLITSIPEAGLKKSDYTKALNMIYMEYFLSLENTYARYLHDNIEKETRKAAKDQKLIKKFKEDIPSNGIGDIIPLITENTKYILLDWDRTVTTIEGMYFDGGLLEKISSDEILLMDLLFYIMGGQERTDFIIAMFRRVIDSGIPIFIITNNPNASLHNPKRWLYIELIKIIFSVDYENADNMLYSAKDFGFKKYIALCNIPLVAVLVESCIKIEKIKAKSPREKGEGEEDDLAVVPVEPSTKKPRKSTAKGLRSKKRKSKKRRRY